MNAAFQGKADTASVATGAVAQAAASMAAEKKRAAGQPMDEESAGNTIPAASDNAVASARPALSPLRATPIQRSTAVVSWSCAREAEPPACSPTRWPKLPASTASTLRPQRTPTAAIWTSCRTLTLLSWRPRQRHTSMTSRPTASVWALPAASPAQAVHRPHPRRRGIAGICSPAAGPLDPRACSSALE